MDAHVMTPIGVTATLFELMRANAAEPLMPRPLKFVCNCDAAAAERFLFDRGIIGAPQATEFVTVEELERRGLVGIYDQEARA